MNIVHDKHGLRFDAVLDINIMGLGSGNHFIIKRDTVIKQLSSL